MTVDLTKERNPVTITASKYRFSAPLVRCVNPLRVKPMKFNSIEEIIQEIIKGSQILSHTKTGALIAFEREDSLSKLAQSGTVINSNIKKELLTAIFSKDSFRNGAINSATNLT